jgi:tripeptide aminopeptidase
VRIGFTPDEEIGKGARLFDIDAFGVSRAYTIDGSRIGELQDESFSAFEVVVKITGVDVHPGQATGKLVSALRLAARVICELPSDRLTPDTTSGREGFIHPLSLTGTPSTAEIRAIVRDFDEERLAAHVALLTETARAVVARAPRAEVAIEVERQYSNMRAFIERAPDVVTAAEEAMRAEGIEPLRSPIRGGTDGSILSERGLPTPNIFDGGSEFHSAREWASVQDLASCAATIVRLAAVWAGRVG